MERSPRHTIEREPRSARGKTQATRHLHEQREVGLVLGSSPLAGVTRVLPVNVKAIKVVLAQPADGGAYELLAVG